MIRIFSPTDKTFNSNGDAVIHPIEAEVHCEDNGEFYLSIVAQVKDAKHFKSGNLFVVPTPQGEQAFRLGNDIKSGEQIEAKLMHVYYDAINYVVKDTNIVDKYAGDAIKKLNKDAETKSPFTVGSNINVPASFRVVRESLFNAFEIARSMYGGHLVRNNFDVYLKKEIGEDNGVTVRYKRNLEEIEVEENWDEVVTKILPVGTDGILLDCVGREKNGEGWIHDDNKSIWLTSDTQYDIPFTKVVSFSQEIVQEDYSSEKAWINALRADLKTQALAYMEEHCVPEVNYSLSAHLDKVSGIGDTIEVLDERLEVDILTHVIAYDYNVLTEKYIKLEFGNFKQSLSGLMNNISASVDQKVSDAVWEVTQTFQTELDSRTTSQSVMTGFITSNVSSLTASSYTKVALTSNQSIGSDFTLSGGSIVIGSGVSAVTVSGLLSFNANGSGTRHFRIVKNSYSDDNTVARCGAYASTSQQLPIPIPPVLVPVQEGDTISMYYYAASASDSIYGDANGDRTNITVQKANVEFAGYSEIPNGDDLAYGLENGDDLGYGI